MVSIGWSVISAMFLGLATWFFLAPVHFGGPMNLPDSKPLVFFPLALLGMATAVVVGLRDNQHRALGAGLVCISAVGLLTVAIRLITMPPEQELDGTSDWPPSDGTVGAAVGVSALVGLVGAGFLGASCIKR